MEKPLSAGTQVVTRIAIRGVDGEPIYPRGAVGVVVQKSDAATDAYRVRFPEGGEAIILRHNLAVRKHVAAEGLAAALPGSDEALYECVIYRCVIGSRAYGLEDEGSDTDRRGIYLPPAERQWSLAGVPEQLENQETQECYWELRKFLILALKANPNIRSELDAAYDATRLPELPDFERANAFLIRARRSMV